MITELLVLWSLPSECCITDVHHQDQLGIKPNALYLLGFHSTNLATSLVPRTTTKIFDHLQVSDSATARRGAVT